MSESIQLLVRHLLMLVSGALAAHHFTGLNTTAGLVLAIMCFVIGSVWSCGAKLFHLESTYGDFTANEAFRTMLGALISQGITAASAYFAIDANDPNLLAVAAINALASRYGLHQQLAHQTPLEKATAIKALALGSALMMSSCAGALAWFSTPAGRVTVSLASLGLDVAAAKGKISPGQVVNVKQGIAVVTDPEDSTVSKIFKLEELGLKAAVQTGKLQPGDAVIIQAASAIVQSAVQPLPLPVQASGKAPASIVPAS